MRAAETSVLGATVESLVVTICAVLPLSRPPLGISGAPHQGGKRLKMDVRISAGGTDVGRVLAAAEAASPLDAVEGVARELGLAFGAVAVSFLITDLSGRALVRLAHVPLVTGQTAAPARSCWASVARTRSPRRCCRSTAGRRNRRYARKQFRWSLPTARTRLTSRTCGACSPRSPNAESRSVCSSCRLPTNPIARWWRRSPRSRISWRSW